MSGAHWADGQIDWLKRHFPEVADVPLYLRLASEVPTISREPGALAWTHPTLDARLRPILEPRGEWSGRGIAIVVENPSSFFSLTSHDQTGVVLHELAHGFEKPDSPQRREDFVWTPLDEWLVQPGNIDRVCSRLKIEPITEDETARTNHGPEFVRPALHVWFRCRHEIPLRSINVFWDRYCSPVARQAIAALDDELRTSGNILDTLRKQMPDTFAKLWPT